MGKYIFYGFIIIVVIFFLELFQIVDIPFLEIPDWLSGKEDLVRRSAEELEKIK